MKTLQCVFILTFCVAISISLMGTPASFASDNDNRYRNDSSSVFAPGYLNAAKYQAEAIINQQTPKKSLIDNIVKYMQGKTENTIEKAVVEKAQVTPKLQQKSSSSSGKNKASGTVAIDETTRTKIKKDIEASIRDNSYFIPTPTNTYNANLDLNNDHAVNAADQILLRNIWSSNDSDFQIYFSKIMAEAQSLIGTSAGTSSYISAFDTNNDGRIDASDYAEVRQAAGYGRADLPASPVQIPTSSTNAYALSPYNDYTYGENTNPLKTSFNSAGATQNNLSGTLKSFLDTNNTIKVTGTPQEEGAGMNAAEKNALAIPAVVKENVSTQDMESAEKLANILKNPTEDQKMILDAVKALLADMTKTVEGANKADAELQKTEDALLNAVANILLAQAMPDLIKKGDIANIKGIFSELDQVRAKIMLDYAQSTKPYYENIIKDLAKNMATLQAKNLLNSSMTREELDKLPSSELDKILEKIKKEENKAFEEEYILQQEAKYRKAYLDPNKKKLEDDMKTMLTNFTGKIQDVLKSAKNK